MKKSTKKRKALKKSHKQLRKLKRKLPSKVSNPAKKPKKPKKIARPKSFKRPKASVKKTNIRKKEVVPAPSPPVAYLPPVQPPIPKPVPLKKKNQYFTKLHEEAILEYASSSDNHKKTTLYISLIQPAFNEMVEKIVYTYKFNNLPNIEDLKSECKIFLTTILDKYDTARGSKAFSYFSVITKNWFIHKVKKNNSKKEIYLEDLKETNDGSSNETELFHEESYVSTREREEFWTALESEMTNWFDKRLKENEIKVYKAIILLFKESENIEIFNKKAVYLYMREITGLNTKQVVNNLKKFRFKYEEFRDRWHKGTITHIAPRGKESGF